MAKKLLLVAEHMLGQLWQQHLQEKGFACHVATTVVEALEYLQKPENSRASLVVQGNLALIPCEPNPRSVPEVFAHLDQYDRGAALLTYAREHGLISSDRQAILVATKDGQACAAATKVINLDKRSCNNLAEIMAPPLHRGGKGSVAARW